MSDLTVSYSHGSFWFHRGGPVARLYPNWQGAGGHALFNLTKYNSSDMRTYSNQDVVERVRPLIPSIQSVGPEFEERIVVSANDADLVKLRLLSH